MRPLADRHGLTMLQLACLWCLAQPAVGCVAPTLIQEGGPGARPIEDKRAELAGVAGLAESLLLGELAGDPHDRRQRQLDGPQGREPRT